METPQLLLTQRVQRHSPCPTLCGTVFIMPRGRMYLWNKLGKERVNASLKTTAGKEVKHRKYGHENHLAASSQGDSSKRLQRGQGSSRGSAGNQEALVSVPRWHTRF